MGASLSFRYLTLDEVIESEKKSIKLQQDKLEEIIAFISEVPKDLENLLKYLATKSFCMQESLATEENEINDSYYFEIEESLLSYKRGSSKLFGDDSDINAELSFEIDYSDLDYTKLFLQINVPINKREEFVAKVKSSGAEDLFY